MSLTRSFTTMPSEKFKIILLGDPAVGKTSLLTRFIFDTYDTQYQSTLGIDFYSKLVSLHDASDTVVRLHLWDTAGQERFHALITNYIRHSAAALIVYDIGSRMSFAHVQHHIDGVRAERGDHVVIVLVGNKSDLPASEREVSCAEAAAKAEACGAYWAEVSAQTGDRVKWLFRHVAQCVWAASAQKRSGQGVPNMAQCGLSHTSHPVERTSFQQDSNEGGDEYAVKYVHRAGGRRIRPGMLITPSSSSSSSPASAVTWTTGKLARREEWQGRSGCCGL